MNGNESRTRHFLAGILAITLLSAPAMLGAHGGEKHGDEKKKSKKADVVSVSGEVLDLSCYLGHGSKGKKHQKCAKTCLVKKHVAAGLLTSDGSVILLVMSHKHEKAFKNVGQLAAEHVTVTGRKVKKGGMNAIMVHKIEKAKKHH